MYRLDVGVNEGRAGARRRRRLALQLALLSGVGLAVLLDSGGDGARAGGEPECPQESPCTFKKPNVLFIVDYSTSMNAPLPGEPAQTRWQAVVSELAAVTQPGSFFSQNTHLALMRFGHDPDPQSPGTVIAGDSSGLIDGQRFDLRWDDEQGDYFECNGAALGQALAAIPPPLDGAPTGIGGWTKGALDAAGVELAQTQADHPEDQDGPARLYLNVVITDGPWADATGTLSQSPPEDDPAPVAAALLDELASPTYVIAVGDDPLTKVAGDELAAAGGTDTAREALSVEEMGPAFEDLAGYTIDRIEVPGCPGGPPRLMILLDASSAMLNVEGGASYGGWGETRWDQARAALAGLGESFYDMPTGSGDIADTVLVGLSVYGDDEPAPGEDGVLVQYGPCTGQQVGWALDPHSSCAAPGCSDPWSGPPITWTFVDGSLEDPPGFDEPTFSHMPRCEGDQACAGSEGALHLGLTRLVDNHSAYIDEASQPGAPFPVDPETRFIYVLIVGGPYAPHSTDAQVEGAMNLLAASASMVRVIAFGDFFEQPAAAAELDKLVEWGPVGTPDWLAAGDQAELAEALAKVAAEVELHPCCGWVECWNGDGWDPGDPPGTDTDTDTGDSTDTDTGDSTGTGADTDTGSTGGEGSSSDEASTTWSEGDEDGPGNEGEWDGGDEIDGGAVPAGRGCSCATGDRGGPGPGLLALIGLLAARRRRIGRTRRA